MKINQYRIEKYTEKKRIEWDDFVQEKSENGTFLQTRRFLEYHSNNKFKDSSVLIYDSKNHLVAVCPACEIVEDGLKIYYSHKGSTFGGIVINEIVNSVIKSIEIVETLEQYLINENFQQVYYKMTPQIFSVNLTEAMEYALYYKDYKEYKEVNSVIFLDDYDQDILSHLKQGKRTNVHNCMKAGIDVRMLIKDNEIAQFHEILIETLNKYQLKPTHTINELIDFKDNRLSDECEFFGAFLNGEMVAGAMMFYFKNAKSAHTQYLCAKHKYDTLSPMSFMYYSIIVIMKKYLYKTLSWGITSEHFGKELNVGLTKSKEAFGSKSSINRIYYKQLGRTEN